jgi:hypothetical protein
VASRKMPAFCDPFWSQQGTGTIDRLIRPLNLASGAGCRFVSLDTFVDTLSLRDT